jgi:FAR1 DNA-binding domain/MULE transposase domain
MLYECQEKEKGVEHHSKKGSFEPYVGMEFPTAEAAFKFYNNYGYIQGFSIRTHTSYKSAKGSITSFRYVCSKQGLKESQKCQLEHPAYEDVVLFQKTPQKQVSDKRYNCKAAIQVRLHKDGIWRVTVFHKEHNHQLVPSTPSKKRNLRSHKFISPKSKIEIRLLSEQNIGASQIREYLATKKGGKKHLYFGKKDVSNELTRENNKLVGVDVDSMLNYFLKKKESDPDFFFAIEPDEDNAAKNIFWVDGRSRRAYQEFGDVVTFDTTYNTNKYSMPLAPFLGANHHRHTIFFGCALIRDEKKMTFVWLLQIWLKAMGGSHPKAIITDQDPYTGHC